jgi:uncharacterized protein (UPF0333 family)
MMVFLVVVITIIVIGIAVTYVNETNHTKETDFIKNASCESLKIYVDAGREGKDHFAYWTMESQETINFKITPEHVIEGQLKYDWECNEQVK